MTYAIARRRLRSIANIGSKISRGRGERVGLHAYVRALALFLSSLTRCEANSRNTPLTSAVKYSVPHVNVINLILMPQLGLDESCHRRRFQMEGIEYSRIPVAYLPPRTSWKVIRIGFSRMDSETGVRQGAFDIWLTWTQENAERVWTSRRKGVAPIDRACTSAVSRSIGNSEAKRHEGVIPPLGLTISKRYSSRAAMAEKNRERERQKGEGRRERNKRIECMPGRACELHGQYVF